MQQYASVRTMPVDQRRKSLRLTQRIGPEQNVVRLSVDLPDLFERVGVYDSWIGKRAFGNQHVGLHSFQRFTRVVVLKLIVARKQVAHSPVFHHDLCRAQHMAGGNEKELDTSKRKSP